MIYSFSYLTYFFQWPQECPRITQIYPKLASWIRNSGLRIHGSGPEMVIFTDLEQL
jgi:hypothetical protein